MKMVEVTLAEAVHISFPAVDGAGKQKLDTRGKPAMKKAFAKIGQKVRIPEDMAKDFKDRGVLHDPAKEKAELEAHQTALAESEKRRALYDETVIKLESGEPAAQNAGGGLTQADLDKAVEAAVAKALEQGKAEGKKEAEEAAQAAANEASNAGNGKGGETADTNAKPPQK